MLALQTAIQTKFNATSALAAAFPCGLWAGLAPAGTAMPYAVVTVVAAPLTTTYGGRWSDVTIAFTGFGTDHDAVGAGMAALTTAFDDALLPLGTGQVFDARRTAEPTDAALEPDASGQTVWRWAVTYRFAVSQP